ncbi:Gfo/Idh/MocA family oxidoreductase [Acidisoma cellulosilytica]|uniref:Gfo/Idh/MocA family oxidoreductase n=1 Tax=Acidisoma cellulosilyticum TaxID=2802395 RepID=A0A963Z3P0_9PROT|nr:Gfo/Idh/MocA family oxidoreductase [Acidisoma cellulosilyticum]MCB8881450.1 Gfo/Idh/MocA family oxidoreductase [Acidisoma cellulosilyticum]
MSLRAVLTGCGAMSAGWIDAAKQIPGLSIAGFVDLDPRRAQAAAASWGGNAQTGADAVAMIDALRPDILFDVAVPMARHTLVAQALSRGCHVLTEKPMAETMAQAADLLARAKAAGRIHAVIQNRRYIAPIRRIRRLLASGVLGRVTSLHCDFFLGPHFGGFREDMRHVLLLDMAIHTFDAARCLSGQDAEAVYCREWNPPGSWFAHESSAAAIFELTDGAVFTYRGSWVAQGLGTSWESAWRIVGERGSLVWDGHDDIRAEIVGPPRSHLFDTAQSVEIPPRDAEDRIDGHLGVMRDFVAAIEGGLQPETRGEDNIKSFAMVMAAIRSAESGMRVAVDV